MEGFRCILAVFVLFFLILSLNLVSGYDVMFANSVYAPNESSIPQTSLYVSPPKVAGVKNQMVTIKANISTVTNLFSFQIGLLFDPDVTECLNVEEGGFLTRNGADPVLYFPGQVNNTVGSVGPYGWTLTDPALAKNGSGTLAKFTFQMKTTGYSNIHIYGLITINRDGAIIPIKIIDSYTPIREQSENSITITGNAQGDFSGHSNFSLEKFPPLGEYHLLAFNVTGVPLNGDAFAFLNVSIPKNLLWANYVGPPFNGWYVEINGNITNIIQALHENATHTSVYFEFKYNATNPTARVMIGTVIDLEAPYPDAELSVFTNNWWYTRGDRIAVRGGFKIDGAPIAGGTVLMKVTYPNMSVFVSYFNITEPNGNATFTFQIGQNVPFGNYSIQLLAGKLGVPGAYAVKYFWVWRTPVIEPYPRQHAYYRSSQYDMSNNLTGIGWFNTSYTSYLQPNLMNCSIAYFIPSGFGNQSGNYWVGINTTTRLIPMGTSAVGGYFWLWIQTNVTMDSQIPILSSMGTVTGSQVMQFRMDDGTIGFIDTWKVEYVETSPLYITHTAYFDKKTGLNVYEKLNIPFFSSIVYLKLSDTNIPVTYNWGDINHDGAVNGTDAQLVRTAWQTQLGNVNFNHDADFNLDGIVNISDVAVIGYNWQHKRMVLP